MRRRRISGAQTCTRSPLPATRHHTLRGTRNTCASRIRFLHLFTLTRTWFQTRVTHQRCHFINVSRAHRFDRGCSGRRHATRRCLTRRARLRSGRCFLIAYKTSLRGLLAAIKCTFTWRVILSLLLRAYACAFSRKYLCATRASAHTGCALIRQSHYPGKCFGFRQLRLFYGFFFYDYSSVLGRVVLRYICSIIQISKSFLSVFIYKHFYNKSLSRVLVALLNDTNILLLNILRKRERERNVTIFLILQFYNNVL